MRAPSGAPGAAPFGAAARTREPSPDRAWEPPPYRAPRWLRGGHAQTIWPALVTPRPRVRFERQRWDTPDGDFIEVDFLARDPAIAPDAPLVVLFHGLEGSSRSHYAAALMDAARRRGWRGAVAHFRGCGGSANRLPRAYHSGDSAEIDWVLQRMRERVAGDAPLFAAGVSLGANALLKWAGEQGAREQSASTPGASTPGASMPAASTPGKRPGRGRPQALVQAVAGVSAPQDLHAGALSLSRGFNLVYTRNFLSTLKRKSAAMLERHPGLFDPARLAAARTFFDFDDLVTAPLHGFRGALDYWRRSSCKPLLRHVAVPALVINARNDPFLPAGALATPREVSSSVTLCYPDEGGHVGFVTGAPPGRLEWLPRAVLGFFEEHLHG